MGSIIAAFQVQEAIKVLHGDVGRSLAGKRLVFDCTVNDIYATKRDRLEDCPGHLRFGEITEVGRTKGTACQAHSGDQSASPDGAAIKNRNE